MTRSTIAKRLAPGLAVLGCATVLSPLASQAAHTKASQKPSAVTGPVGHVRGSSGELEGTVVPGSQGASYYFKYGPTLAYGSVTPTRTLTPGTTSVKVGDAVIGLFPGYHYRLVATSASGTAEGKDRTFTAASLKPKLTVVKPTAPSVYGKTITITGTLAGTGNANRSVVLQASPYPFLTPFSALGLPTITNAAGAFVFSVSGLKASTQFRVATLAPRPLYSLVITEQLAVRATLKVRTSATPGLVRLYGTVTPAEPGAEVSFQLESPARSHGKSERTIKYSNLFSTRLKPATKTMSRFSTVVTVRHGGRYRAFVQIKKGPLSSGESAGVVLHGAPATKAKKH